MNMKEVYDITRKVVGNKRTAELPVKTQRWRSTE